MSEPRQKGHCTCAVALSPDRLKMIRIMTASCTHRARADSHVQISSESEGSEVVSRIFHTHTVRPCRTRGKGRHFIAQSKKKKKKRKDILSKKKRRRRRIKKKNKRNNNNEKVAGEGFGGWRGERGRGEKPSKTEGDRLKEKRGYNFRTQLQQITAFFFF